MEEILKQILEGQNSMREDISSMKEEMSSMKGEMSSIKEEMSSMKLEINKINIKIEDIDGKIKLLVEGHENILESNERNKSEIIKESNLRFDIIEKAIIKTNENLNDAIEELDFVKGETALNTFEVKYLKKVR